MEITAYPRTAARYPWFLKWNQAIDELQFLGYRGPRSLAGWGSGTGANPILPVGNA